MTIAIALSGDDINQINISPAKMVVDKLLQSLTDNEQQLRFEIDFLREETDPRELSEIPEIRLWFIRLDTDYPWLIFFLDWKAGELGRYVAMLVPHQFSPTQGIQYNPEALEIFVMHKVFVLSKWMKEQGISSSSRLKSMAQMFGYELDEGFFELIE